MKTEGCSLFRRVYSVGSKQLVLLFVGALLACGSSERAAEHSTLETSTQESVRSSGMVDGFYVADGAPDPLACTADSECTYGGIPRDDGCCFSYVDTNAAVMSVAYRRWVAELRASCNTASCPPRPSPAQPAECLFDVSCEQGRCVNGC